MVKILTNKKILRLLLTYLMMAVLFACAQGRVDPFDLQTGTSKKEIKDIFFGDRSKKYAAKKVDNKNEINSPNSQINSIPNVSKIITIPSPPRIMTEKLMSFSVNQEVPLKDVLIELAKAAKLDIDLDQGIEGGVIVSAKNRSLIEILDRVCDMGNLRYTLNNNRLYVEKDLPFAKNYSLDFLIDSELWGAAESGIMDLMSDKSGSKSASSGGSVSSNKLSNIMTIFASQKNHIKVANYLEKIRKNSSAQVLIEAKVVEVTLKDNYKTGIDWGLVSGKDTLTQSGGGAGAGAKNPITLILGSVDILSKSINSTISALEEFGVVKGIASPRINTLNNQKAKLNFTKKLVYFTSDVSTNTVTTTGTSATQNAITSTMHTESLGTELSITPTIDLETNEITLDVKPKITIKSDEVDQIVTNPSGSGASASITNKIPIINTRELNTTAKIKSGNVLVIGGVMTEDSTNADVGVPFLSRIPILGYLFRSTTKTSTITETVIFVKATIVGIGNGVSKYDKQMHETFSSSNRPFINQTE